MIIDDTTLCLSLLKLTVLRMLCRLQLLIPPWVTCTLLGFSLVPTMCVLINSALHDNLLALSSLCRSNSGTSESREGVCVPYSHFSGTTEALQLAGLGEQMAGDLLGSLTWLSVHLSSLFS